MASVGSWVRVGVSVGMLGLVAAQAEAQIKARLSAPDIEAALAPGGHRQQPLRLRDVGSWFAGSGGGYAITVFTPTSWIRHLAATAAERSIRLTIDDLTLDDAAPVLRILAEPSTPTPGARLDQSSSVRRVVLRRKDEPMELEPVEDEPINESFRNLAGSTVRFGGMMAVFSLDDLRDLRGTSQEFIVRIVGTGYTKDFEIKRKHFAQLP